jgi:hypothetical protein
MAHFAKLDENNIVIFVTKGRQEDDGKEQELFERTGDVYRQTSYNTHGGIHYNAETGEVSEDQSKAFRKNYAGLDYFYDELLDAFIPPKPFESWLLDLDTCLWNPPVPYPTDDQMYEWDEPTQSWIIFSQ